VKRATGGLWGFGGCPWTYLKRPSPKWFETNKKRVLQL